VHGFDVRRKATEVLDRVFGVAGGRPVEFDRNFGERVGYLNL